MNQLHGIPESMLIPLAVRSRESDYPNPIIIDELSKQICESINHPFENISKSSTSQVGISIRTRILDNVVTSFIDASTNPLIINIGCGLDTRYKRLCLDKAKIPWIDIDVPEVIEIRKQFFQDSDYCKMIAQSMLDFEWIDMVKTEKFYNKNMDILIVFEGVLMYFDEKTIKQLLEKITTVFNMHRLSFAIEFCSKTIAQNTQHHKSVSQLSSKPTFKFGYNTLHELHSIKPKNIKIINEFNYFDYFHKRWGFFGLCRFIPYLKNRLNNKIVTMSNEVQ